jgi:tetratricopeptide (TPR) repeat protein
MRKKNTYLIVILLIVASCAAFGRIAGNDFIKLDDDLYITENNHIKSGINPENIKWAFTAVVSANWHPLTLLSHTLDWSLFRANASGHHLVSLLLHIGAVVFLFLFLNKTTNNIWPSAFVAAFFALHPLRVESVAWAAERKDVLSMFFAMATLYVYALYVESSKLSKYLLCLILFILSLMAKPTLVTLPFVLLLLDYWPLERWQKEISLDVKSCSYLTCRLLCEKAPFLFLAIISSMVTLWAQNKGGMIVSLKSLSFSARVQNAIISYASYLGKTFWPVDLAVVYPYGHSFPLWQILVSCFILTLIIAIVIYVIKKKRFLFVGWFWYLGTLIPVIGLVQLSDISRADRYTYLPSIGIAIMLAWGIPSFIKTDGARKKILFPAGMAVLAILAVLTWQQCGYWKNSAVLFSHALQVTKDNHLAHNIRGITYSELGQYQRAIEDYNEAIRLKSNYADAYNNRGHAYSELGQYQRAIEDYNEAIRLNPTSADTYNNRGRFSFNKLGQYQRAIEDFNEATRLNPELVLAYEGKGAAY